MPSALARAAMRGSPATMTATPAACAPGATLSAKRWKASSSISHCGRISDATSPPASAERTCSGFASCGAMRTIRQRFGATVGFMGFLLFGLNGRRSWLECGIVQADALAKTLLCVYGLRRKAAYPRMLSLLSDPWFYAAAVPAVVLVGLSKGGLGGAGALMGVPLMTLVISPVQAAAIMLPILLVMDAVSLWTWR